MIAFLKRLFARVRPADDRVVIEQASFYEALEKNCRRRLELDRAVEREQDRVSRAVGSWARDAVHKRHRPEIPRSTGRDTATWLPGLSAQEIINLSQSSALAIRHHIFSDDRIPGVRKVQPLPESLLIWPKPRLVADADNQRSAGGGPRLNSRKLG